MKKKSLKGMTLVEVIVALAIFAMLGVILVQLGTVVDKTTRSSNRLNKRVAIQAPNAAAQDINYQYEQLQADNTIKIVDAELTPNFTDVEICIDDNKDDVADTIKVKRNNGSTDDVNSQTVIYGNRYSTKELVDGNTEVYNPDDVSNTEHHLQFIDIVERIELELDMHVGDTYQISYKDNDGNDVELSNAVWKGAADSDKVATISDTGLVKAVGTGKCVYTGLADGGRRYLVTITVT